MKKSRAAIEASGMVDSHVDGIIKVAKETNTVIMVRPVNKYSTNLIKDGFATKDLHVKGKSSDWGPQAGFICCDQSLSKLRRKGQSEIPAFNKKVEESIKNNFAKSVPLIISKQRVEELIAANKIFLSKEDVHGVKIVISRGNPSQKFQLYPSKNLATGDQPLLHRKYFKEICQLKTAVHSLKTGYFVMHNLLPRDKNPLWSPVMVLAECKSGTPLTADYDLFSICPHLSRFHTPSQSTATLKTAARSVMKSLGTVDRRIIHDDMGRMTLFSMQIRKKINQEVKATGSRNVVHHGCEVDNPVTEMDFPITIITPSGDVIAAENQVELQDEVRKIQRSGYAFYANRLWSQEGAITSTTRINRDYKWDDRYTL